MYHKKTYLKKTDEVKPHVERKKVGEKNRWDIPTSYKALVLPQFTNAVWKNNEMDWTIITIYVPTDTVIQEYEK